MKAETSLEHATYVTNINLSEQTKWNLERPFDNLTFMKMVTSPIWLGTTFDNLVYLDFGRFLAKQVMFQLSHKHHL